MKFYVYIADSKVDALLAELEPDALGALARDLALDPQLLLPVDRRRAEADETRFVRATAIASHLERTGASGALRGEAPYVTEQLSLHWGRLRQVRDRELLVHETESPVLFAGAGQECELLMTGSASRLLAQPPSATIDRARTSASPGPSWFTPLTAAEEYDGVDERSIEHVFAQERPPRRPQRPGATPAPWMERLARAHADAQALPVQRVDVLAKRLMTFEVGREDMSAAGEPTPRSRLVFASPVLVAIAL